jgi:hypothetical protein
MKGAIPLSRAQVAVACALASAAAGTVFLLAATANGGTARATGLPAVTQADYSAFGTGADASGLTPPSASAGEGNRPVAASMTRLGIGKPNLTVLLAKSSEGGVCVFVERRGAKGAGGSCATAALLRTGATGEMHEDASGERTIAGVVPDGVSSVKVGFADGASRTVTVVDNGWAIENAPAGMTSATDIVGG